MASDYKFSYSATPDSGKLDSDKPPFVLIHGFMGSKYDWVYIIDGLKDNRRCIAIDLPGHGNTKVNGEDDLYKIETTARGIIDLADKFGIDVFDLLGYSMGGRLALYIAIHYPERVNSLILESSSPGLKTTEERKNRRRDDQALCEKIMNLEMSDFISQWYDMPLFTSMKQNPGYGRLKKRRMLNNKTGLINSLKFMGTGSQPSLWDKWKSLEIESLLIAGEYDTKYTAIAKEMCKLNKNAKMKIIPDAGHNSHFEKSDIFVNYVNEFLTCK